jgi:hypothetical protein
LAGRHINIAAPAVDPRIPLGLYATILTALGAGIPQVWVLRAASLTEDEWQLESAAWGRAILAMIEKDPSLLGPHDEAILAARDRLSRSVEPLDSSVGAWLSFQAAWVRAPEPSAFLREHGLTPLDMMRIAAQWSKRFTGDEPLRLEALECMQRAEGRVPEIRIGPWPMETAFVGLWDREKSIPPEPLVPSAPPPAPEEEEAPVWTALPGKPPVTERPGPL